MKKKIIVISSILLIFLLIVGGFAIIPTDNESGESGLPIINLIQEKKIEKDITSVSNFNVFLKNVTESGRIAKNVIEAKEIIKEEGYEGNFLPKSKDNHYYFNNEDSQIYLVDDSKDNEIKIVYAEENVELKDEEIYRLDLEYFPMDVSAGYELSKNAVDKSASEVEVTLSSEENKLPEEVEISGAKLSGYNPETGELVLTEINNDVFVKPIPEYEIVVKLTNVEAGLENAVVIKLDEEFTLNYTAPTGYALPQIVAVTGADFTWDYELGALTIKNPTENVSITIVGQALGKANQNTPTAPTVLTANIGTDKITLTAKTGGHGTAVYAINSTNEEPTTGWTESLEFTELTSGVDYYFFVKFLGDSKYNESAVSEALKVTTLKADQTAPASPTALTENILANTVTLTAITTTGHGDVEYATSETDEAPSTGWQSGTEFTDLTSGIDHYFFARYKGDTNYNASPASTSLKVTTPKADQAAPAAPEATKANITATKVTLTAITTTGHGDVEYAKSENETAPATGWQSGTEFTGLTAGKVYYFFARYKGDTNYNASPASAAFEGKNEITLTVNSKLRNASMIYNPNAIKMFKADGTTEYTTTKEDINSSAYNNTRYWVYTLKVQIGSKVKIVSYEYGGGSGSWSTFVNFYDASGNILANVSEGKESNNDIYSYTIESLTVDTTINTDCDTAGCFVAGTKITMADGSVKNIEDVVVGDKVLSYNVDTKEYYVTTIAHVGHEVLMSGYYEINLEDGTCLNITSNHPILTEDGFKAIKRSKYFYALEKDDLVLTVNGPKAILDIIYKKREYLDVYYIDPEDDDELKSGIDDDTKDTHIADGVIVHNGLYDMLSAEEIGEEFLSLISKISVSSGRAGLNLLPTPTPEPEPGPPEPPPYPF